jgi:hypothetical protein
MEKAYIFSSKTGLNIRQVSDTTEKLINDIGFINVYRSQSMAGVQFPAHQAVDDAVIHVSQSSSKT